MCGETCTDGVKPGKRWRLNQSLNYGYRPVVIVQNDVGNKFSPTTIVAAISTQIKTKAKLPTHYYLKAGNGLIHPSVVMLEQIRTIDKTRLEHYIGTLSEKEVCSMNHALAVSIDLPDLYLIANPTCRLLAGGIFASMEDVDSRDFGISIR